MTVVEARHTARNGRATAGLGWLTGPGPGVFYEAEGDLTKDAAREEIDRDLTSACELRDWTFTDQATSVASVRRRDESATAVVLAVYGDGGSI